MTKAPSFQKSVLPNGIRLVSEKIPSVRSAALGIWVTVGSRHESAELSGISHFIEHMAFKGTASRSAMSIAKSIERGGGHINAFTGKELTCFYVHVLDEQLPMAVDILCDILQNSLYDPAEMEKEKQVILDEIRDHEDMPDDVVHKKFVGQVFKDHPIARPILGSPKNVSSFTRDNILGFMKEHYNPHRIVVAAAGNVKHAQLEKLIAERLSAKGKRLKSSTQVLKKLTPGFERSSRAIQQAHMLTGGRSVSFKSKDRVAVSMLNTVLGGGMSSRLFQNIREKHGIAYAVYSFADALSDTGYFEVYLATDKKRVERAHEMVLSELKDLQDRPLTKQELEEIKIQYKGGLMLGLENTSSRMMRLARMEIYQGRFVLLDEIAARIDAVTPKRIQAMANMLYDKKNLVTTLLEPNGKKAKLSLVVPIVKLAHAPDELPSYATLGAAGMDLCLAGEAVTLLPGERKLLPTGFSIAIPDGYEGQVRMRSGFARRTGCFMPNSPGTIDSDYRGELLVLLMNATNEEVVIESGERFAQLVISPVERISWALVSTLSESVRGAGGFGSTGRS